MKHIVCFSRGHSSALVAIEVSRRYGKESVILLSHAMNPEREEADIRRFGKEVSEYLGIPVTYANYKGITDQSKLPDQFDVSIKKQGFKITGKNDGFCTAALKTEPFNAYLAANHPNQDCVIYYGFDKGEEIRKNKRIATLMMTGWESDYPLIDWTERTIASTREIGIEPPNTYAKYAHANCTGCLKGGIQHWYVVYHTRGDIWEKAKRTEAILGHSILKNQSTKPATSLYLADLESTFDRMSEAGIPVTEHYPIGKFRHRLKKYGVEEWSVFKPCECVM